MADSYAVRTIRRCTKDCLCLFVCPTGATDTENSIIDVTKCTGCGVCAAACPNGAITMVPKHLPPQQPKSAAGSAALRAVIASKAAQEALAERLSGPFAAAAARSARLQAEDLAREAGFMLPQSANTRTLLAFLQSTAGPGFPAEACVRLLSGISPNE